MAAGGSGGHVWFHSIAHSTRIIDVMQREIVNKVVIITGASSGIGRQTAMALGRERARLVLVARRSLLLDEIRIELEKNGTVVILPRARSDPPRRCAEDD